MKKAIAILAVLSLAAFAGQVAAVSLDPIPQSDADRLSYDDGTAGWYTWGGMYRGVWFNVQDFLPGAIGATVQSAEFWFYHSSSGHTWDTSQVYLEIWNGTSSAPETQINKEEVTAATYTPITVDYTSDPLSVGQNFWALSNVEMSSGGWPSSLGDKNATTHSFLTEDFVVWEPWNYNYFIRVDADITPDTASLGSTTWGSLKAAF